MKKSSGRGNSFMKKILITAFSAGFLLMVLELAASRVFAPFFGSSLIVWTAVIGIFMAAMALGYYWGGVMAKKSKYYYIRLAFVVTLLFSAAIPFFAPFVLFVFKYLGVHLGSILSAIVVFGLPAFFLSNISPLLIQQLNRKEKAAGFSAGEVYAVSTVGSIVGTFVAGFILLPYLGVKGTMLFVAAVSLILALTSGGIKPLSGSFAIFFALLSLMTNFWGIPTPYHSVMITEENGIQYMFLDDQAASALNLSNYSESVFTYSSKMKELMIHQDAENIALVGGGGCTQIHHIRDVYPDAKISVVDIDSKLFDICEERFFVPVENVDFIEMDGRLFLEENQGFDIVFVDVYSTRCGPPIHFTTVEFFRILGNSLNRDGIAMMNVVAPSPVENPGLTEKLERTIRTAGFEIIEIYPTPSNESYFLWNYVVLIGNFSDPGFTEGDVFTDDKNDFTNFYVEYC